MGSRKAKRAMSMQPSRIACMARISLKEFVQNLARKPNDFNVRAHPSTVAGPNTATATPPVNALICGRITIRRNAEVAS